MPGSGVKEGKQGSQEKAVRTNFETHTPRDSPSSNDGYASTAGVAENGPKSHPPVVLTRRHGDGSDLAAVSPFSQESHDKGLNPSGAQEQRQEVVQPGQGAHNVPSARRRATAIRRGRGAAWRRREPGLGSRLTVSEAHLQRVRGDVGSPAALLTSEVFLLLQLHLDLLHLCGYTLIRAHGHPFLEHASTEHEEETGREKGREALWNQSRQGVAQHGGQDRHCDERAEGGGEDHHAIMFHGHEGCHEEGFIANLGDEDHGEGEDEGVQGLDETFSGIVRDLGVLAGLLAVGQLEVVLVRRFRYGRCLVVRLVGQARGFLISGSANNSTGLRWVREIAKTDLQSRGIPRRFRVALALVFRRLLFRVLVQYLLFLAVRQRGRFFWRLGLVPSLLASQALFDLSSLVLLAHSATRAGSTLLRLWSVLVIHDTVVGLGNLDTVDYGRVDRAVLQGG